MKSHDNTAISCSLTTAEFHDREARVLAQFRSAVFEALTNRKTAYESLQVYEFLFPDKTRQYDVFGQTE
jgi:hypothetical protein